MSRQSEREEFINIMSQEGVKLSVSRQFLRAAASLHRIAELSCSSEWADRDRVPCPKRFRKSDDDCLCRDYGSMAGPGLHGDVPRYAVREAQIEKAMKALAAENGLGVVFGGDPRGAVLLVTVPSGRTNDWGKRGIVAG